VVRHLEFACVVGLMGGSGGWLEIAGVYIPPHMSGHRM